MGKELSGLAQIAIASSALVLPACNKAEKAQVEAHGPARAQDSAPPTIVSASLDDGV